MEYVIGGVIGSFVTFIAMRILAKRKASGGGSGRSEIGDIKEH